MIPDNLSAIGSTLANHLWQSTLFAVLVGFLTLALRKNGARLRYRLWLAASVKFLIPWALLIGMGGHWARSRGPVSVQTGLYSVQSPPLRRVPAARGLPIYFLLCRRFA
jgi:bla regulator protein BlaR1